MVSRKLGSLASVDGALRAPLIIVSSTSARHVSVLSDGAHADRCLVNKSQASVPGAIYEPKALSQPEVGSALKSQQKRFQPTEQQRLPASPTAQQHLQARMQTLHSFEHPNFGGNSRAQL